MLKWFSQYLISPMLCNEKGWVVGGGAIVYMMSVRIRSAGLSFGMIKEIFSPVGVGKYIETDSNIS